MRPARCSSDTTILGRRYRFEDMLSAFLLQLRAHAGGGLAEPPAPADRRPAGALRRRRGRIPALALTRYETAFRRLGFTDIRYAYEPVAAAFFFARKLTARRHRAGRRLRRRHQRLLDHALRAARAGSCARRRSAKSGVGGGRRRLRLPHHRPPGLAARSARGPSYRAFDNVAADPARYYAAFARWDQLALMRASRDMRDIRGLVRTSLEPEKLARLVELLDGDHGYRLYQAVSRLKEALSSAGGARCSASSAGSIAHRAAGARAPISRAGSRRELAAIEAAVDEALAEARPCAGRYRPGVPDRRLVLRPGRAPPVRRPLRRGQDQTGGGTGIHRHRPVPDRRRARPQRLVRARHGLTGTGSGPRGWWRSPRDQHRQDHREHADEPGIKEEGDVAGP